MARSVVVLPQPGWPQQHDEFPVADLQIELADDVVLAEILLDVFEYDRRHSVGAGGSMAGDRDGAARDQFREDCMGVDFASAASLSTTASMNAIPCLPGLMGARGTQARFAAGRRCALWGGRQRARDEFDLGMPLRGPPRNGTRHGIQPPHHAYLQAHSQSSSGSGLILENTEKPTSPASVMVTPQACSTSIHGWHSARIPTPSRTWK